MWDEILLRMPRFILRTHLALDCQHFKQTRTEVSYFQLSADSAEVGCGHRQMGHRRGRKPRKCQVAGAGASLDACWCGRLFTNLLFLAVPLAWSHGFFTLSSLIAASGPFDPFYPDGSNLPGTKDPATCPVAS